MTDREDYQGVTHVRCGCGDMYPAESYDAGYIDGAGMCANCKAGKDAAPTPPADVAGLVERLRMYADDNGFGHLDYADSMSQAADALARLAAERDALARELEIARLARKAVEAERDALRELVTDAQAILAAHLPPDGANETATINALLTLLDGPRSRAALARAKEG